MSLPVLLSIPHGGETIPPEVADRFALTRHEWWYEDSDPCTRAIYEVGERAQLMVAQDVVRAVVDMNRAPDDDAPANPDGITKTHSCYGRPIWKTGLEPDRALRDDLIARYHATFHARLREAVTTRGLRLALDCHSMAAVGPEISPDRGQTRPAVCLSNQHGATCPNATIERLAACMREAFGLSDDDVSINAPFAGGYITRTYGMKPLPWIQVELSRARYLAEPWYDPVNETVDPVRLATLRDQWSAALELLFRVERT